MKKLNNTAMLSNEKKPVKAPQMVSPLIVVRWGTLLMGLSLARIALNIMYSRKHD